MPERRRDLVRLRTTACGRRPAALSWRTRIATTMVGGVGGGEKIGPATAMVLRGKGEVNCSIRVPRRVVRLAGVGSCNGVVATPPSPTPASLVKAGDYRRHGVKKAGDNPVEGVLGELGNSGGQLGDSRPCVENSPMRERGKLRSLGEGDYGAPSG